MVYTNDVALSPATLDQAAKDAMAGWAAAGEVQAAQLSGLQFQVGDLAGLLLGYADGGTIFIDSDAAGHGWSTTGEAGKIDLASVVLHEIGHVLGMEHTQAVDGQAGLMGELLTTGQAFGTASSGSGSRAGTTGTTKAARSLVPAVVQSDMDDLPEWTAMKIAAGTVPVSARLASGRVGSPLADLLFENVVPVTGFPSQISRHYLMRTSRHVVSMETRLYFKACFLGLVG